MRVHGIDLGDQLLAAAQELGQLLVLEVAAEGAGAPAAASAAGHRLRQGAAAARAGSCCCLAPRPTPGHEACDFGHGRPGHRAMALSRYWQCKLKH